MRTNWRSPSGRYWDWQGMAKHLRTLPGKFAVTLPNEPTRVASSINQRRHPDLVLPDGRLEAITQNVYTNRDGKRRGDVRVRFIPTPPILGEDHPPTQGTTS